MATDLYMPKGLDAVPPINMPNHHRHANKQRQTNKQRRPILSVIAKL